MKKVAFTLGLVISLAVVAFGQRTITNFELEKFQQKRLAAERDYRENYARMGFPSPEELDRQREADMTARIQLSEQLRQARLEKERLELERRSLDLETVLLDNEIDSNDSAAFYGAYVGGFGGYGGFDSGRRHRRFGHRGPLSGSTPRNQLSPFVDRRGAYRVTPFQVIPVPHPQPTRGGRRH